MQKETKHLEKVGGPAAGGARQLPGSPANRAWLKAAGKKLEKAEALREKVQGLTDEEMKEKSLLLKGRVQEGEKLDKLLPEAFALAREAALRVTGMEPYPVQVLAGIALHEGRMVEQKTGEGKTLAAVLPSYLNALAGKGVHVVTVNDYLAKRDAQSMGKIHEFLGLTVGAVTGSSTTDQRKAAYACDITYVTNAQLGFDWLRDNMVQEKSGTVLRGLEYVIIDEADSILIDEARTPLIISGDGKDVSRLCMACDVLAKSMERGYGEFNKVDALMGERAEETGDFIIHEKEKTISLTGRGVEKAEKFFRLEHYGDEKNINIHHALDLALRANWVMEKDKDYIVRDGKVQIVDEFTGRVMPDRQYSDGMHQAVEAKEGVEVRRETRTIATTTYQSFFNKFKKKAGMTGTAWTARQEFWQIYHMRTVVIPTNKPMVRVDREDRVFMTKDEKYAGVLEEVRASHMKGQPVLIGTVSVEASEELSKLLRHEGITHQVLNAKQDKKEAEIIAQAGRHGAVTIATNMAGRGTDIILDEESVAAGGLKVVGTERHESLRIDNQLRGRAGRQGDPGESVFCVAMDDRVTRLYAPERLLEALNAPDAEEDRSVQKMLWKAVRSAQKNIEDEYYQMRKNVLEFGLVNDRLCEAVYAGRKGLLEGNVQMDGLVHAWLERLSKKGTDEIVAALQEQAGLTPEQEDNIRTARRKLPAIEAAVSEQYRKRKEQVGGAFEGLEQFAAIRAVDLGWREQLSALEYLQQASGYNAFAQDDPETVYANEAYRLYGKMKEMVQEEAIHVLFHALVKGGSND
ncbi:MAG: preprotein translocase subunit SecA [Clostridiales bacterium]|nr:preprotein translocase subunit SecA [Clostridiales bacterium]